MIQIKWNREDLDDSEFEMKISVQILVKFFTNLPWFNWCYLQITKKFAAIYKGKILVSFAKNSTSNSGHLTGYHTSS